MKEQGTTACYDGQDEATCTKFNEAGKPQVCEWVTQENSQCEDWALCKGDTAAGNPRTEKTGCVATDGCYWEAFGDSGGETDGYCTDIKPTTSSTSTSTSTST